MPNSIGHDDCHIWHFSFKDYESEFESLTSLLSPDEHERLSKYQFDADKLRFGLSRGLLRKVLSTYADISPESISFNLTDYKKPFIDLPLEFNVSHCKTDVVIGIAKHPIGVDIETTQDQPQALEVAKRFFSSTEYEHLKTVSEETLPDEFLHMWTQKEAIVKAIGKGVFHDLKSVEVSPLPQTKILSFHTASETVNLWSIYPVPVTTKKAHCCCAVKGTVKKPVMMAI